VSKQFSKLYIIYDKVAYKLHGRNSDNTLIRFLMGSTISKTSPWFYINVPFS